MSGYLNNDGSELVGALNPSSVGQALKVDAAGNLKVTPGGGGGVTLLNHASAGHLASGNSGDLAVSQYTEMAVDCNVTAFGGGGDTVQFFVDRKGVDGIYYPVWTSVVIAVAQAVSTSIGAGMSIAQSLGTVVRLRWVIVGVSATFSASLIAK